MSLPRCRERFRFADLYRDNGESQMNKAIDWTFELGWVSGGVRFYPYQVGIGISMSFWPCIQRPDISIHVGPFKLWVGISGQKIVARLNGK